MSIVLSVYSIRAFKEFVLPASDNIETFLTLRRDIFRTNEDIFLKLENVDGDWYFTSSTQYWIAAPKLAYEHKPMHDGDYFKLFQNENQLMAIMVRREPHKLAQYRKFDLHGQTLSIGINESCAMRYSFKYEGRELISQTHVTIAAVEDGLNLTDMSKNGVFVNDIRVIGNCQLHFGDRIDIWGLSMVSLGQVLAVRLCDGLAIDEGRLHTGEVPCEEQEHEEERVLHYHRAPRKIGRLNSGVIEIEAPPNPQQTDETPLFMSVGPALTMALPMLAGSGMAIVGAGSNGIFMYTGLVTAVLSAAVGTVWAVVNVRYDRTKGKKEENHRFEAYGDYLVRITEDIRSKYDHNRSVLLDKYPSVSQCLNWGLQGQHLWERNTNHEDFLSFRLGLGDCPFQTEINIPPEKFELLNDTLREKPSVIRKNFNTLHNVPVCIDLAAERIVGLVGGPDRMGARELLQLLTAQIASQTCYTEVKMVFIYQEDQGSDPAQWGFCRWLPHVWSQDRRNRFIAANKAEASDVLYEIMRVLRVRSEMSSLTHHANEVPKPWYILAIADQAALENEPITKYIFDRQQNLGVTTLLLANQPEELPNCCSCIIRNDSEFTGMYHLQAEDNEEGRIIFDRIDTGILDTFSRYLANVEINESEVGGEIPAAITFFDMYGISRLSELDVPDRWKKNRTYENMRALIGQKSGNLPCYLDIHEKYHGPHGLIAGTTGSGKSETLQTYILSLAINFSPYDVGLFLIDYKGGGMANLFNGLPHIVGQISNLSGGQIRRAMVSIKSENVRRQRIFNASGVNNINLYTNLIKNGEATIPVPHLFIIIDEFAELKREQPDFMRELISVAQVGRSLGVHLILATQKPSGTVDDNIWSNSKFRICLRVQDRQDSMDMLHKPDAAYLTQAGRGYLQVGSDEVYEQFQSGWSGAVYDEESDAGSQDLVRMLDNTGKTELTGSFIKRRQKEKAHVRWLNQLLECLDDAYAEGPEDALCSRMYALLSERHIAYPERESNTRALENFISLEKQVRTEGAVEGRAERISGLASKLKLKLPEAKQKTQLDAVVEYLAQQAEELGYEPLQPLWLDPLPKPSDKMSEQFCLSRTEGWKGSTFDGSQWPDSDGKWDLSAVVGLCDDPENQAQFPLSLSFSEGGHHVLIGSTASGKSTFVQTLVYSLIHRYTPAHLNIYILDFSSSMSSAFSNAPHVGGILYENDCEGVGKLFYLLQVLIAERKQQLSGGNYEQYVRSNGVNFPAVLLVIDNIANFREKTGEEYDGILRQLSVEGEAYGIYLFITAAGFNIMEIPGRIADNIRTSLCLELTDIYQYGDALRCPQPQIFPESGTHGRGLVNLDGRVLEYQTAQAVEAQDDFKRNEAITAECEKLAEAWHGKRARKIPFIPSRPTWQDFMEREEIPSLLKDRSCLPVGYDYATAGIYCIDLRRVFCYTVSGRARSGKTNLLKSIMRTANKKDAKITVIEPGAMSLKREAKSLGAEYCSNVEETVDFVGRLGPEFQKRYQSKQQMVSQGMEEDEIFARIIEEEPWFVFIADLYEFIQMVYSPESQEKNLHGALENLIGKGFMHNIYFIAGFNQDNRTQLVGEPLYDFFVHDKTGIHLGGNVAAQQLFDFTDMPFKEQGISEKPGSGLVPPNESERIRRIILPLAKG